ncbi:nonribosomal peptide synthetase dtxS1 [Colletotrichum spaethianum]|uniref:Nonribosomal peptide synthetase dtxS1 n=1 Tax=Colletotrichum spaethianum TaxID=700344 RepID=A0AA37LCN9_9PEZI|nr:nonribosomal peptide synthetase dtxS1 [Colletotrichum spaethianum]GKT45931.1 nonribosomal peptide synthetase dtxS1 [Colletotrichum spaethianum]
MGVESEPVLTRPWALPDDQDLQNTPTLSTKPIETTAKAACSAEDFDTILSWNDTEHSFYDECLHWHFEKQATSQPDSPAILSSHQTYTYGELEATTARLAKYLSQECGVGPEVIVPVCFPKSALAIVAMLSILRAGGAYTALDPKYPDARIQQILQQTQATTVLASPDSVNRFEGLVQNLVPISEEHLLTLPKDTDDQPLPSPDSKKASPKNACIVVFTSGSTGTPKGIVLEHRHMCATAHEHGRAFGIRKGLRVLQFAAYTFDMANSDIFCTLFHGGTICVPSENERMDDLAGFVARFQVESAKITPSLAGLLTPADMPSLKTIILGGEVASKDLLARWADYAQTIISYGPAECAVTSASHVYVKGADAGVIGRGFGTRLWIVDPHSCHVILPIGSVGELLVEGPNVGRGYLANPELTEQFFVGAPDWCSNKTNSQGEPRRFYKTGDLVQYDSDGAVRFVGRKDSQIKLRGQRLELGEVQHHLKEAFPKAVAVLPAMIAPHALGAAKSLAAFVQLRDGAGIIQTKEDNIVASHLLGTDEWQASVKAAHELLSEALPSYMVPAQFIPVSQMPTNASWKTDVRRLQELAADLPLDVLTLLGSSLSLPSTSQESLTETELKLQELWATVLGRESGQLGLDDSFFHIGGNSLEAIRLVGLARAQGLDLTVQQIFQSPKLRDQAGLLKPRAEIASEGEPIPPLSLLNPETDRDTALQYAAKLADVEPSQIEDIFPCTPLQEGLLAMTAQREGDYVARSVYRLPASTDLDRFKRACEEVVAKAPTLRTRVVSLPDDGLVQVVVNESFQWGPVLDMDSASSLECQKPGQVLGSALSFFALAESAREAATYFVWTIHHALYDGWSAPLILDAIEQVYSDGQSPVFAPFQGFVKHVLRQDKTAAEDFWRVQFDGGDGAVSFPALPDPSKVPLADTVMDRLVSLTWIRSNTTPATAVRTAWAILQSQISGSKDIVFGATLTGRQADVAGVERMTAPTIAPLPVRVTLQNDQNVQDMLQSIQQQMVNMLPFEQFGVQNIKRVSGAARDACQAQTLLLIQPAGQNLSLRQNGLMSHVSGFVHETKSYALTLYCYLEADGVHIYAVFDSSVIKEERVSRILGQFEHILKQLSDAEKLALKVSDLEVASPQDMRDIWRWNAQVPPTMDRCVHDMIINRAHQQPEADAIHAWDGDLTYEQLDTLSSTLARRLIQLGVGPNMIVPLCFEKSMWTPVAVMGVMKAGGCSVLLDGGQPEQRLQTIVQQVAPSVMIASALRRDEPSRLCASEELKVVVLDRQALDELEATDVPAPLPAVPTSSLLYLVFTSGSTGLPKGAQVTHSNYASALHYQGDFFGYQTTSRVYDFASYSFDGAWFNMLHTLEAGGCVCIPLDEDRRNDLAASINHMGANMLNLNATTHRLLNPATLPAVNNLISLGEPIRKEDVEIWTPGVIKQAYGPAECTPISTALRGKADDQPNVGIGSGLGSLTWVVDSETGRLMPPGITGELWLEGPIVGAGYLNEKEKTAAAFVHDPAWLLRGGGGVPGRQGRLYRTGDLVRQLDDGPLVFVGRKDTQVKIRGQRVELEDIEHHLHRVMVSRHENVTLVAEVIKPEGQQPILVAYVALSSPGQVSLDHILASLVVGEPGKELATALPAHLVPTAYIPLEQIPLTMTGKTDRKRLREMGAAMTRDQLVALHEAHSGIASREPSTPEELQLRELWARVLNQTEISKISAESNFFVIGGDSIQAMRMVALAHEHDMRLTVADIFQSPRLSDMAKRVKTVQKKESAYSEPQPFTLLSEDDLAGQELGVFIRETIAPAVEFHLEDIQDVMPTTATQAMCADAAMHDPAQGCFMVHVDVPERVSLDTIEECCQKVWNHLSILAAVFVTPGERMLQVIPRNSAAPVERHQIGDAQDMEGFAADVFHAALQPAMVPGSLYTRFYVLHGAGHSTRWGLRLSHAHFDRTSLTPILDCFAASLQGKVLAPMARFSGFVGCDAGALARGAPGLEAPRAAPTGQPAEIVSIKRAIRAPPAVEGFTAANLYVAACVQALAQLRDTDDVVTTMTVSGRSTLPPALANVVGPTVNMVPLRVRLDAGRTFRGTLEATRRAQLDVLGFETSTAAPLFEACTPEATWRPEERRSTYIVQFQNPEPFTVDLMGDGECCQELGWFGPDKVWEHSEEVWLIARPDPETETWNLWYSANTVNFSLERLEELIQELEAVVEKTMKGAAK